MNESECEKCRNIELIQREGKKEEKRYICKVMKKNENREIKKEEKIM